MGGDRKEKYWFFRSVAEVMGEGIIVLDERGTLTFMNPEAERLLGWREAELLGRNMHMSIHHTRANGSPCPLEECPVNRKISVGESYRVDEELFIRKDGTPLPVAFVSTPLLEDGWVVGSVSVFRDISAEKMAKAELVKSREAAVKATKLKDRFVGLVAHDLRSPLGALIGFLKWIERDGAETFAETHKKMMGTAIDNAGNLMNMIDGLLDIAKLNTGEIKPVVVKFPVRKAVELALAKYHHAARDKGITLANEVPEGFEINADFDLYLSVLHNLVSNAVKFSRKGDTITVFSPKEHINAVAVRDTGVGVPPGMLPKLFTQGEKTTIPGTGGEKGNGLGLTFSHEIIRSHGGALWAESGGRGSTFYVTVP